MRIAQHFSVGSGGERSTRPKGTVEIRRSNPSAVPWGRNRLRHVNPRLKPWAILKRPSGTPCCCDGGNFRKPLGQTLGLALALALAADAGAQTYTVLKSFTGSDGANPVGGLVVVGNRLYGTTDGGGSSNCGVVFGMNMDGSGYDVLKSFNGTDGAHPAVGLALAGSTLYGTTANGGPDFVGPANMGSGLVFKVNIDGSGFTVLKAFTRLDGQNPAAVLSLGANTIYGTAPGGRYPGNGVVFQMNTDGSGYTILKGFAGGSNDGDSPSGGLLLAGGALYGTTLAGGSGNNGVVFRVNVDGSDYAVLKSFYGSDGSAPVGDLVLAGDTLYGATMGGGGSGGGVLFKVRRRK